MNNTASNSLAALGFLTAVEDPQHGYFGGYLVLSQLGRPLEFHCSTPVKPTKAQRILYGNSLRSYVLGELIGQTLVKRAKLPVDAVLTDLGEMLILDLLWDGTLALVASAYDNSTDHNANSSAPAMNDKSVSKCFEVAGYQVSGSSTCAWETKNLRSVLAPCSEFFALDEPFQRIREAILEAQRVTEQQSAGENDATSAAA